MSKYKAHAICNRCGELHNMYVVAIRLYACPQKKESIADIFAGKELSSYIAALTSTKFICSNTKRFTLQEDNNQIFSIKLFLANMFFVNNLKVVGKSNFNNHYYFIY